jgi:hypothetical protein
MKHILSVAAIFSLGLCLGCGPGEGTEFEVHSANCLSSAPLAQSEVVSEAKTLAELIGLCSEGAISVNTTEMEVSER